MNAYAKNGNVGKMSEMESPTLTLPQMGRERLTGGILSEGPHPNPPPNGEGTPDGRNII